MAIRIFSNRESVEKEEISILAIVETSIATAVTISIYLYSDSIKHILFASLLAPFLLLRTKATTDQALGLGEKVWLYISKHVRSANEKLYQRWGGKGNRETFGLLCLTFVAVIAVFVTILLITLLKIYVVLTSILKNTRHILAALPKNWRKVVLCLDSATLPEILPGIEAVQGDKEIVSLKISIIAREMKKSHDVFKLMLSIVFVIIFVPAYAYRLSLKSTALIWSPLLWIVGSVSQVKELPRFLHHVATLTWYRLSRYYSALVILMFAAKVALFVSLLQADDAGDALPGWGVLRHYVVPTDIPLWQVAGAVNAALAWALLFIAEPWIGDPGLDDPQKAAALRHRFWTILVVRNALSVYTALCTIYITAEIASGFALPPLRVRVFPWQEG